MNYVPISAHQRQDMLQRIGVAQTEDLFDALPPQVRLDADLELPEARSELQLQRDLTSIAQRNQPAALNACFLGGGAYDHFIPSAVDALAMKREFVTAYTPYQAEASQGSLQAFFEFQTQVARLAELDVANASLYEGATAAAEAVLMALNVTGKRRVIVAQTLHPDYQAVIRTYLDDLPATYVELPAEAGRCTEATLRGLLDDDTACVVVASPNRFGLIEDWTNLFATTHEKDKTLAVAVFNPIAAALLKRPGACGADIAVAEGQPLGIPLQFGGPYLGLFAASQKLMRKMPGRLVGQTTDRHGQRSFCLTLQTREQHIRGAKATSNVCTNQGLLAMRATVYLSSMGPRGLTEVARQCLHKAHYAADQIRQLPGYSLSHDGPFFHEFLIDCPVPARKIIDVARTRGILPGLDAARLGIGRDDQLLIAVTEKRSAREIADLVTLLKECAAS